jgi:hypothetical protein
MKTLMRCVLLAFVCVAAGCGTYRQDYAYDPAAVMSGQTRPRLMASIFGVLRGSSTEPAGVDVRLRLEAGEETAEVIREDLQLVTADLVPLELLSVEPEGGMVAPAEGAQTWRLVFVWPAGHDLKSLDLAGLMLTWRFRAGEAMQGGTASFSKLPEPLYVMPYSHPWWHGPWRYHTWGYYYY